MILHQIGGRRFLLTVGCGIVTSLLLWYGKLGEATYATVILGTVGAYIAANTYQKKSGEAAP